MLDDSNTSGLMHHMKLLLAICVCYTYLYSISYYSHYYTYLGNEAYFCAQQVSKKKKKKLVEKNLVSVTVTKSKIINIFSNYLFVKLII